MSEFEIILLVLIAFTIGGRVGMFLERRHRKLVDAERKLDEMIAVKKALADKRKNVSRPAITKVEKKRSTHF